jgi:predicted amidohydrolase
MSSSTSSTARTISVAQLRSGSNKLTNLLDVAMCAGLAKRDGACMLFLPENFGFMGESADQTLENAETPLSLDATENPSSVTQALRDAVTASAAGGTVVQSETKVDILSLLDGLKTIARASDMWISGGGMAVSGAPPGENDESSKPRVYNTHVVVDNKGNLQSYYRKVHLFDVSIPGKVNLRESAMTAAGTELVLCDSPIGTY